MRPLNPREVTAGDKDIIRAEGNLLIVLDMQDFEEKKQVLHRSREQRYVFDKVFIKRCIASRRAKSKSLVAFR